MACQRVQPLRTLGQRYRSALVNLGVFESAEGRERTISGHDENKRGSSELSWRCMYDYGERVTVSQLMTCGMPPITRGQTWLFQPLPESTVPNTGMNLFSSSDRGLD